MFEVFGRNGRWGYFFKSSGGNGHILSRGFVWFKQKYHNLSKLFGGNKT